MSPYLDDGDVVLHLGDCVEVMRGMPDGSVDAVVTDPPYGLGFMGKEWDADFAPADMPMRRSAQQDAVNAGAARQGGRQRAGKDYQRRMARDSQDFGAWCEAWATEALRVAKPGAHLLAFGGTRTFHRLTCAIEDAGWEIRDCLSWLYGSGFPKSLDVSKAIDKAAGAEREVIGQYAVTREFKGRDYVADPSRATTVNVTAPATPEAAVWQGWGTALKPAWEPVVVARKPLTGTVAANILAHGTGAINVDGCRVEGEGYSYPKGPGGNVNPTSIGRRADGTSSLRREVPVESHPAGRWPANVVLDEAAAGMLDEAVGELQLAGNKRLSTPTREGAKSQVPNASRGPASVYADPGGPSRFFYTAKASTAERDGATHPTVKPLALMRWLARLVTPPGGVVLDPFAGSGTTLLAARDEGFQSIGIERDAEYAAMAAHRLRQLSLLGGAA